MKKFEANLFLTVLTQMDAEHLGPNEVRELQRQLRLRLRAELESAKDEAIKDLLDFSSEDLAECSAAARAVVSAYYKEGADTEEAEQEYFREHPEVLELYLPN